MKEENKVMPVLMGTFLVLSILVTGINLVALMKKKKTPCKCNDK